MEPDTSPTNEAELGDENDSLNLELASLLKNLLEEEHQRVIADSEDRRRILQLKIETREAQLGNDSALDELFADYLDALPDDQRPKSSIDRSRLHIEWHDNFTKELDGWKEELVGLKNQPIDKRAIFNRSRERLLRLFRHEAAAVGLLPQDNAAKDQPRPQLKRKPQDSGPTRTATPMSPVSEGEEKLLSALEPNAIRGRKPRTLKLPAGQTISIESWIALLPEIAEWLIQKGEITQDHCPIRIGELKNALIDHEPIAFRDGKRRRQQKQLSGGFFVDVGTGSDHSIRMAVRLLRRFGEDPSQFSVQLS